MQYLYYRAISQVCLPKLYQGKFYGYQDIWEATINRVLSASYLALAVV